MNKDKCFDIGILQAFIDGELASDQSENVVGHIALCDSCATLLAEAEEESAMAFSLLDDELNVLVPTERLRTKVLGSISESKEKASWWEKIAAGLGFAEGFSFSSPSFAALASVVLFVGAIGFGVKYYQSNPDGSSLADNNNSADVARASADLSVYVSQTENVPLDNVMEKAEDRVSVPVEPTVKRRGIRVMNASGSDKTRKTVKTRKIKTNPPKPRNIRPKAPLPSPNLDGEDSYLQTIASLNRTVGDSKDMILRPTERIAYERDMAVVDDAIKKMKKEVRKNPKNRAAREVLRSSYKNKIDLLNSVAEKTELMASIE